MNSRTIERYLVLFICLVLLGSTIFSITVSADEPLAVRFGVYQNPPLVFTTEGGYASGIFIDLLEYIADKESWTIEYVPGDWADLLEQLERGEIDMIGAIAHTEARSALFDFSTESVITNWGQIYTRADAEIESILDLEGKTLAMLKADIHAGAFKSLLQSFDVSAHLIEVESYQLVFGALQKGEADAGVVNRLAAMKYLGDYDVRETSIIFNPVENCYAVTKGVHQDFVAALNANLRALKADDSSIYHQSLEKWFGVRYAEKPVIPWWVYYILIVIGGLALLLLGGNFILKSQVRSKTKELRQEITEREQAEEAVRVSEERLRSITENSSDNIMLVGQDLKILFINKTTPGLKKEDVIGKSINDFAPKDFQKLAYDKFQSVFKTGKPTNYQTKYLTAKGEINYFDVRLSPITREGKVVSVISSSNNVTERKQAEERLKKTMDATIDTVSKIVEVKDPYTAGHQQRVSQLATAIAKELNLSQDKIEGIRIASLIHDAGKIGVPTEILSKTTTLSDIEFSLIKEHSQIGYDILKSIDFSYPVARIVLQHHEKIDGSGYPNKLKGDEILLEAKILGVADVVEAMSSHRPYRPALGIDKALEEISQNKGILYDPEVVDVCIRLVREKGFKF